jgi:hypothetical protein
METMTEIIFEILLFTCLILACVGQWLNRRLSPTIACTPGDPGELIRLNPGLFKISEINIELEKAQANFLSPGKRSCLTANDSRAFGGEG